MQNTAFGPSNLQVSSFSVHQLDDGLVQILQNLPTPMIVSESDGQIIFSNRSAELLLGSPSHQVQTQLLSALLRCDNASSQQASFAAGEKRSFTCTVNGANLELEASFSVWEMHDKKYLVSALNDVTGHTGKRRTLEYEVSSLLQRNSLLENLVNLDPLTGLLNRRGLQSILTREASLAQRNGTDLLAALLDLDNFKGVNDQRGHNVGDQVLINVAQSMKECVRASDWVSRVGGDEFVILLPATPISDGLIAVERVRSRIATRIVDVLNDDLRVTVSIGLAHLPDRIGSIEQVLQQTQTALRTSKQAGKNCVAIDVPADDAQSSFAPN